MWSPSARSTCCTHTGLQVLQTPTWWNQFLIFIFTHTNSQGILDALFCALLRLPVRLVMLGWSGHSFNPFFRRGVCACAVAKAITSLWHSLSTSAPWSSLGYRWGSDPTTVRSSLVKHTNRFSSTVGPETRFCLMLEHTNNNQNPFRRLVKFSLKKQHMIALVAFSPLHHTWCCPLWFVPL